MKWAMGFIAYIRLLSWFIRVSSCRGLAKQPSKLKNNNTIALSLLLSEEPQSTLQSLTASPEVTNIIAILTGRFISVTR